VFFRQVLTVAPKDAISILFGLLLKRRAMESPVILSEGEYL